MNNPHKIPSDCHTLCFTDPPSSFYKIKDTGLKFHDSNLPAYLNACYVSHFILRTSLLQDLYGIKAEPPGGFYFYNLAPGPSIYVVTRNMSQCLIVKFCSILLHAK